MILVAGADGRLGRLVLAKLHETRCAVRATEYGAPEAIARAMRGIDRLILIASSDLARRVAHHRAAIDAAVRANVGTIVYTSILHADVSPLALAADHRRTEAYLAASGIPHVLLRNGWFIENDLAVVPTALASGTLAGSSGGGRIAWAALADYAAAAVAVVSMNEPERRVYELAGDDAYTRHELAAEISRRSGKSLAYRDLPEAEYAAELVRLGVPASVARVFADSDRGAARGGLFDDGRQLSALIGRPTTPLAAAVATALNR